MASKKLAVVLAENLYECLELQYPRYRLLEAGFDVKIVGPEKGATYTSKEGYPVKTDGNFEDVNAKDIGVLVIPGGMAPDKLRRYPECKELVSDAWNAGAVVAFICHGGWVPISAKIVKGRKLTSVGAIRDDLENAGATWVDKPVVVDGKMVTAQVPKDLPDFMKAILKLSA